MPAFPALILGAPFGYHKLKAAQIASEAAAVMSETSERKGLRVRIAFGVGLRLKEESDWDVRNRLCLELARTAARYGYGIQLTKWYVSVLLEIRFIVTASPAADSAHNIFKKELQDPLNWETIRFPNFLLEVWQLPETQEAVFIRTTDGAELLEENALSIQEMAERPKPISIYRAMDAVVALRTNAEPSRTLFYLNKKASVLHDHLLER